MSKKVCNQCAATGKVRGMGWITESCPVCGGDGYIYINDEKVSTEVTGNTEVKIRKKRTVKIDVE